MRNVIRLTLMLLVVPMVASAQWTFHSVFPDSTTYSNSHGLVVDADGNLWNAPYYSLLTAAEDERYNPVFIWDANGQPKSFSPLKGTVTADTLLRFGPITGVNKGADGNIYIASHGWRHVNATGLQGGFWNQSRSFIHVIDPATGDGIEVVEVTYIRVPATETALAVTHAPNRPAVTEDGFVVISFVFGGSPIVILDPNDNWAPIQEVTDSKFGFSRTLEVSADGTMIYNPTDGGGGQIQVLVADDIFSEFEEGTPLAVGTPAGAISRYPVGDIEILFFSGAGVGNDPVAVAPFVSSRYYGYSVESGLEVDTFDWNYGAATTYRIPRAMAFSDDGLTAYVGSFNQGNGNIQKFTRAEVVSIDRGQDIATGFELSQNYPNPFNPSTTISYTLATEGYTTLRVYDMLGRVVATLVNDQMPAGTHTVNFFADQLGSGVYLYELTSGSVRLTNKMTLVK